VRKAAWYFVVFLPCVTLPLASVGYFMIDDSQGWAILNLAFALSGPLAMPLWSRYMDTEKSERLWRWVRLDPRNLP
jgi:hypothetical protein